MDLSKYKGKIVLIVNVASQCGFTPQYKELAALYDKYSSQGLVILGFPCNQVSLIPLFLDLIISRIIRMLFNLSEQGCQEFWSKTLCTALSISTGKGKAGLPLVLCYLQFGGQEPGTNDQVKKFAQDRGAKFPIMAKVDVNGSNGEPGSSPPFKHPPYPVHPRAGLF